jgi:hypothetical protein
MSASLPELRIVPNRDLVPHETCDPARTEKLQRRLAADGVLRNPLIVAPIPESQRYVVLDGANRVAALQALGMRDVLVQVTDYAALELRTWHHLLVGVKEDWPVSATELPWRGSQPVAGQRAVAQGEAIACVLHRNGRAWCLPRQGCLHDDVELLRRLVSGYPSNVTVHRVESDDLAELADDFPSAEALVLFPRFRPEDILELARQGARLPAGITRHIVPGRVLHANLPLSVLADERPIAEKNAWLRDWLSEKLARGRVRFYPEPTFVLDD